MYSTAMAPIRQIMRISCIKVCLLQSTLNIVPTTVLMHLVFYFRINMSAFPVFLCTIVIFFFSCSSGSSNEHNTTATTQTTAAPSYDNSLVKGRVIDSVVCKNNSQNYALYLPSYYTADKTFPCIYFFDAHARGALPLRLYKDLAEKYGFVLVGSNVSKNGTACEATNDGVKSLLEDVRARINIDAKRIYTCGFSGGSRVASSVAIMDGGIAGVIGCAAGFPPVEQGIPNKFDYFGLVGNFDFNLTDMEQLDAALDQNGFTHQLLTFNGKHDWPPAEEMQTALLWIQVNAMKENVQPKSDTIVAALKNDYSRYIADAASSGDLIREQALLSGIVRVLNGIEEVSSFQKRIGDLVVGDAYKKAIATHMQLQQAEAQLQQELVKQFTTQNEKWWKKEIATMNQSIHTAKTKQEGQMYQRALNYLGLVSYMNSSHAINTGDLANAATYLGIFKMADPHNPDCGYLSATYFMKKGKPQQAIASLNEAASLGFSDVAQLTTDSAFGSLHDDVGFKNIVNKIRANATR